MLGEALAAARGIDDALQRAWALVEVAQRLPPEQQTGMLGETLAAARGIDDAWSRARALAEVAPRLPAEQQGVEGPSVRNRTVRNVNKARIRAILT
jgi:hypothetical protein